jgi:hypothetical protein
LEQVVGEVHDRRGRDGQRRAGKNSANTGIRIVPRPNSENSVKPEVRKAMTPIRISSMRAPLIIHRISLSDFDYY